MNSVQTWIDLAKAKGFTDEQLAASFKDLTKLSAAQLYGVMILALTDEDLQAIEAIQDDEAAEQEIEKRFTARVGTSIDTFVAELQQRFLAEATNQVKAAE